MLVEQEENMQIELLTPLTAEFIPDESVWDDLEEDDGVWQNAIGWRRSCAVQVCHSENGG